MTRPQRQNRRRPREGGEGDDYDEEDVIHHGLRRARVNVSWEYRDSSSLTPLQFMLREAYYELADDMLFSGIVIAHMVSVLIFLHLHYKQILNRLQRSSVADLMAPSIARLRTLIKTCKDLYGIHDCFCWRQKRLL